MSVAALLIGVTFVALIGLQNAITSSNTSTITLTATRTILQKPSQASVDHVYVELGGTTLLVEIADQPEEHGRGLSGRQSLSQGWGMLFIFDKPGRYSFWMYGMLFSLDIIWLDKEARAVHLVTEAQPCPQQGQCPAYSPESEALYVLEIHGSRTVSVRTLII